MKCLVFLGEISFSTYMLHVPLFAFMRGKVFPHLSLRELASAAIYAASLVAVSALSWAVVEKRGRVFLLSLYDRWSDEPIRRSSLHQCRRLS